jgi:DNA-binding transcriptional regulator YdaS (Cro superfamily)
MKPLLRAVKKAGGYGELARLLGVAPSLPSMWRQRNNVPAEYCPAIERETGVRCEALRPDVPWGVLRQPQPKTEAA